MGKGAWWWEMTTDSTSLGECGEKEMRAAGGGCRNGGVSRVGGMRSVYHRSFFSPKYQSAILLLGDRTERVQSGAQSR